MNTNTNNTSIAIATAAAKTLKYIPKRKGKRDRKGYYPVALTLLAAEHQVAADPRLQVIRDFLRASSVGKTKSSPRRDFIIQALYDGIVAAAHEHDAAGKDDTLLLS